MGIMTDYYNLLESIKEIKEDKEFWNREAIRLAAELGEIKISNTDNACEYTLDDDEANAYGCSKCGMLWILEADTPQENKMNYCPGCGSRIIYKGKKGEN